MTRDLIPFDVRVPMRDNVRERCDPYIEMRLLQVPAPGDMHIVQMTVPEALRLIGQLTDAIRIRCERGDIRDALTRTDPYSSTQPERR